jgi:hypothetical protein
MAKGGGASETSYAMTTKTWRMTSYGTWCGMTYRPWKRSAVKNSHSNKKRSGSLALRRLVRWTRAWKAA